MSLINIIYSQTGNDENIIGDFGDLSYYCQVGVNESTSLRDLESRAQFRAINACLSLLRGEPLSKCAQELETSLEDFVAAQHRLSTSGCISLFRYLLLRCDLKFASGLLGKSQERTRVQLVDECSDELLAIQQGILDELQLNAGEETERFVEKQKSCYDNLCRIKNLFNPLLHFFVHAKLRLGSLLMLKAVSLESSKLKMTLNTF